VAGSFVLQAKKGGIWRNSYLVKRLASAKVQVALLRWNSMQLGYYRSTSSKNS